MTSEQFNRLKELQAQIKEIDVELDELEEELYPLENEFRSKFMFHPLNQEFVEAEVNFDSESFVAYGPEMPMGQPQYRFTIPAETLLNPSQYDQFLDDFFAKRAEILKEREEKRRQEKIERLKQELAELE